MPALRSGAGTAAVTPGVTFTDNLCLSDADKQSEWIGTITPEASITASGNRANLDIFGLVRINSLEDEDLIEQGCTGETALGDRSQFQPQLNGTADAAIIENWLFIDGTARIYQNEVTPFAAGGDDPFDRTGNTNTTYSYSVSPYVSREFKDAAELDLRYIWDEQTNTSDFVRDSTSSAVEASLRGLESQSRYGWGISGQYSKVTYDGGGVTPDERRESELSSAQIEQGFRIDRRWQINGFVGQEWNDFVLLQR